MNSIQVRCRIEGTYKGEEWVYEDPEGYGSQYIHVEEDTGILDPYTFWWSHGNFSCDCNRYRFLPEKMQAQIEDEEQCGKEIRIRRIIPLEGDNLPVLELNEEYVQPRSFEQKIRQWYEQIEFLCRDFELVLADGDDAKVVSLEDIIDISSICEWCEIDDCSHLKHAIDGNMFSLSLDLGYGNYEAALKGIPGNKIYFFSAYKTYIQVLHGCRQLVS